jgi:hypothetical protein
LQFAGGGSRIYPPVYGNTVAARDDARNWTLRRKRRRTWRRASGDAMTPFESTGPETAPAALLVQLLAWIAVRRRLYGDTMDAWRTSCPRLPVWEDAVERGLIEIVRGAEPGLRACEVRLTRAGRDFLDAHGG